MQFRQVQQQDFQEESLQFGTNTLLLSGLVISETYEVQVLAVNGKGRGPPSTPATIYVGEAGEKQAQDYISTTVFQRDTDTDSAGWGDVLVGDYVLVGKVRCDIDHLRCHLVDLTEKRYLPLIL